MNEERTWCESENVLKLYYIHNHVLKYNIHNATPTSNGSTRQWSFNFLNLFYVTIRFQNAVYSLFTFIRRATTYVITIFSHQLNFIEL